METATTPSLPAPMMEQESLRLGACRGKPVVGRDAAFPQLRGTDRAIPSRPHYTTGAVTGSSPPTCSRRKYCTAANFPGMVFARIPSDVQHHEENSTKAQVLWLSESLDSEDSRHLINLRNLRQDRRPDSYVRLVEPATELPTYWRPRCGYRDSPPPLPGVVPAN